MLELRLKEEEVLSSQKREYRKSTNLLRMGILPPIRLTEFKSTNIDK